MRMQSSQVRRVRTSDCVQRCCASVIERLEGRLMLSGTDDPALLAPAAASSATFADPQLDPASDTGISSSDGITSDNTPLLHIDIPQGTPAGIWATESTATGVRYVEIDPITGSATGRQFSDTWGSFYWSYGSALGDGKLYTMGAMSDSSPIEIRTYDLATQSLVNVFPVQFNSSPAGGLAYLNGKLYAANTMGFSVIDPSTGAILDRKTVFKAGWFWTGTGPCLAASPEQNALYTVDWQRSLTKIDPATGTVLQEIRNFDSTGLVSGLAYSHGRLYTIDYNGQLTTVDPLTGQRLSTVPLGGFYVALAGDGLGGSPYYRVLDNGVQITGSFEFSPTFQAPTLADGRHDLVVSYYSPAGAVGTSDTLTLWIDTRSPAQRPAAAIIDASSDTGVSSTDGITADATPLLNVVVGSDDTSMWTLKMTLDGLQFTEINSSTGQTLSSFTDPSVYLEPAMMGAAVGDGVIYVAGTQSGYRVLRTYDITTRQLIGNVNVDPSIYGLAFLNGKLYAADLRLIELNPKTGAVISSRDIFTPDGGWVGTGGSLAADPAEGVIYTISWLNRLVKIDPVSGAVLSTVDNVDAQPISGLAFSGGELIATTYRGDILRINRQTGALTPIAQLPVAADTAIGAAAGDGQKIPLYYRVFSDGVQISGDYETAEQFQMPELSSGTHIITMKYVDAAGNLSGVGRPSTVRIFAGSPVQPVAPWLDGSSDSGTLGDRLTNDNTPLLQVPILGRSGDGIVRIFAQGPNSVGMPGDTYMYFFDTQTRTIVGQTLMPASTQWDWAHGAAINDGLLYFLRTPNVNAYPFSSTLSVFNADNGALIYEVPLEAELQTASLAYLDGTLYAAGAGFLYAIDPLTGETLSEVYPHQWNPPIYTGLGANLTGAADLGRLFAIDYMGQFMSIDPSTGESIVLPGYDSATLGMAYAGGELIALNHLGIISHIDPNTGAILSTYQFPGPSGLYSAAAGEGAIEAGSDTYYRVFCDGLQISGDYELGGSFQMPQLADGEHSITIAYVDAAGNVSAMSDPLTLTIDTAPPVVQGILINDGADQRSMVNQVTITFDAPVSLADDAIRLTLLDGTAVPLTNVSWSNPSGDGRTYVLTFSGEGVIGGSLADGLYELTIAANSAQDAAGNALASDAVYHFHRLFGDTAGDGSISADDLQVFIDALSARYGQSDYSWYFDYDASGRITGVDMSDFIQRFIHS